MKHYSIINIYVVVLLSCSVGISQPSSDTRAKDNSVVYGLRAEMDSLRLKLDQVRKTQDSLVIVKEQREILLSSAEASFSRSISILDIVIGAMGVFTAVITAIAGYLYFRGKKAIQRFDFRLKELVEAKTDLVSKIEAAGEAEGKLIQSVKDYENRIEAVRAEIHSLSGTRAEAEQAVEKLKSEQSGIASRIDLLEKPTADTRAALEKMGEKLRELERVGGELTVDDYLSRSSAQADKGLYSLAVIAAENALELDSKNQYGWGFRGVWLMDLESWAESLSSFNKALEIDPEWPEMAFFKGKVLKELGRETDAEESTKLASKLHYNRAIIRLGEDGDPEDILDDLKWAIDLDLSTKQMIIDNPLLAKYRSDPKLAVYFS